MIVVLKGKGIGLKIVMLNAFRVEELSEKSSWLVATDCKAFVAVRLAGILIRLPTVVVKTVMSSEEYDIEIGKLVWLDMRNCRAFIDVVSVHGCMVWVWIVCKLLRLDEKVKNLAVFVRMLVKPFRVVSVVGNWIKSPTVVVNVVTSVEEYSVEIGKLGWLNRRNCKAFVTEVSALGRTVWVWIDCKLLRADVELKKDAMFVSA